MIIKDEFLSKLRRYFGLNLYEVKIWTALLSRGVSTAGELSDIADVPRSRSYDVLESLEKKGFVVMKIGKPIKYIAVEPAEVVERVKKNIRNSATEKVDRLEDLKATDVISELANLHQQGVELTDPQDMSGSLKGRHNLYNHMELTLRGAEKSVTIMTTTEGFQRKIEGFKPIFEQLKARGVDIKIVAPITEDCKMAMEDLDGLVEVRHHENRARFIVVDGREVIFMVMDDADVHPTYDVGIWVNTPFFASALDSLFNIAWESLVPAEKILKIKK